MNNQRGFATIEILLVIMIIAALSTVALPNMARMVDMAQLNYEMKILLSTLNLTKSLNKNSHYNTSIFEQNLSDDAGHPLNLPINYDKGTYPIIRNAEGYTEIHELPAEFLITTNLKKPISFDNSNDGHITITSRYGVKRYIIFDSVGRWRGDITPP